MDYTNLTPKKSKPMTKDEVTMLVDLIQNNPVLTSKQTNAATNKIKEEVWGTLACTFNSRNGLFPRSKDQLKSKWDNLKKTARKRAQSIRMDQLKTGGGKPDFVTPDEILDKVCGMMGSTCTGFEVPFGGDGVGHVGLENFEVGDTIEVENLENIEVLSVPDVAEEDSIPSVQTKKKRKKTANNLNKSKGKEYEDSRRQLNLVMIEYFKKKKERTESEVQKTELEVQILRRKIIQDKHKSKFNCLHYPWAA